MQSIPFGIIIFISYEYFIKIKSFSFILLKFKAYVMNIEHK